MNNAAAITAVNRARAHYRRRQAHSPTDHSAREIAQMSVLAEYLLETHKPDAEQRTAAAPPVLVRPEFLPPHNSAGAARFPPCTIHQRSRGAAWTGQQP